MLAGKLANFLENVRINIEEFKTKDDFIDVISALKNPHREFICVASLFLSIGLGPMDFYLLLIHAA